VESAGMLMVESAGIDMVESVVILVESVIIFEESVAIFSPAIVESFAGAAAAAGAGLVSGSDLLQPLSMQAATNAERASVRVIRSLGW
jgi:hypothetical protein